MNLLMWWTLTHTLICLTSSWPVMSEPLCSVPALWVCSTMQSCVFGHSLWTACVFILQELHASSCQRDPQSIRAHIITAPSGHVPLKPQPGPPFWVFHHLARWSLGFWRGRLALKVSGSVRFISLWVFVALWPAEPQPSGLRFLQSGWPGSCLRRDRQSCRLKRVGGGEEAQMERKQQSIRVNHITSHICKSPTLNEWKNKDWFVVFSSKSSERAVKSLVINPLARF